MNENEQMQKDLSASITDDEDDHLYQSSTINNGFLKGLITFFAT